MWMHFFPIWFREPRNRIGIALINSAEGRRSSGSADACLAVEIPGSGLESSTAALTHSHLSIIRAQSSPDVPLSTQPNIQELRSSLGVA